MEGRVSVLVAFITLGVSSALGADAPLDRATLRGLKALQVVVDVGPELQQAGIKKEALAAKVRQRLESANVTVDANATDLVGVKVTAAHSRNTPYAVCVEMGIYQSVSLKRDPTVITNTVTWSGESVLLAPPKLLQEVVPNTVDQLVDQFLAALRSVNPSQ